MWPSRMVFISVIIPTYQRGHKLRESLDAVMAAMVQAVFATQTSFELIVVDDCSADGTMDFLRSDIFDRQYCRYIRMPENSGPGLARNAGVSMSRGQWIWFLDDDDKLDASQVIRMLAVLHDAPKSVEILSHSLKNAYPDSLTEARQDLMQKVIYFQEHQEVFRHVVRRSLIVRHQIKFSRGFHEDIRYVFELIFRSSGLKIFPFAVVYKQNTEDSITAQMNDRRIDGYIKAYNEICAILQGSYSAPKCDRKKMLIQTLGVLILLITRERDDLKALYLLRYLWDLSDSSETFWAQDLAQLPVFGPLDTNFEYAGTIWLSRNRGSDEIILSLLRSVFETRLCCKDLDSSLFLGPDEIRACCKRFFVNGLRKGDVVLLSAHEQIDLPQIQAAKEKLIDRINAGSAPECSGCPYIERQASNRAGIDYLSLENFAYCNMRCTYCSSKYYGGTESKYNAAAIVEQLAAKRGGFEDNFHVVWGGGEPTLSSNFDLVNQALVKMSQAGKVRVLSNSLKFSASLENWLRDSRFHLVTSIDAGTEQTFLNVRGKGGIREVINNVKKYHRVVSDPQRITIKYIINEQNFSSADLEGFVELVKNSSLLDSLFQVSCDFTLDAPDEALICALYELALRLLNAGAHVVFFDDLVRERVYIDPERAARIRQHLAVQGINTAYLWTPESSRPLVLWGGGMQARWMMQQTTCGKAGKILAIVRDAYSYREIISSANDLPAILPAGVQSMYDILRNIDCAGLAGQLVRAVVL